MEPTTLQNPEQIAATSLGSVFTWTLFLRAPLSSESGKFRKSAPFRWTVRPAGPPESTETASRPLPPSSTSGRRRAHLAAGGSLRGFGGASAGYRRAAKWGLWSGELVGWGEGGARAGVQMALRIAVLANERLLDNLCDVRRPAACCF